MAKPKCILKFKDVYKFSCFLLGLLHLFVVVVETKVILVEQGLGGVVR